MSLHTTQTHLPKRDNDMTFYGIMISASLCMEQRPCRSILRPQVIPKWVHHMDERHSPNRQCGHHAFRRGWRAARSAYIRHSASWLWLWWLFCSVLLKDGMLCDTSSMGNSLKAHFNGLMIISWHFYCTSWSLPMPHVCCFYEHVLPYWVVRAWDVPHKRTVLYIVSLSSFLVSD